MMMIRITYQEVDARSESPDHHDDRYELGNTDMAVALDYMQQLQQFGRVEQADQTKTPQTLTPTQTIYLYLFIINFVLSTQT